MSKHTVTIEIDTDSLQSVTDEYLATMWHVAQANPADGFKSPEPGRLAEAIGREIIRRFLATTPAQLYLHQGHHYDWGQKHLPTDSADGAAVEASQA